MKSTRILLASSACLQASLAVGVCALGCSDDSNPMATGTSAGSGGMGSGGSDSGGSDSGAGGAATAAGAGGAEYDVRSDPAFGVARPCPTPEQPLVTSFTPPAGAEDAGADAGVV